MPLDLPFVVSSHRAFVADCTVDLRALLFEVLFQHSEGCFRRGLIFAALVHNVEQTK